MDFLCPINVDSLPVAGRFGSDLYQYVNINLKGCQLADACLPDTDIYRQKFNLLFLSPRPNILG